jgi:hypothetical protein
MEKHFDRTELSWKDLVSSILVALVLGIFLANTNNIYLPFSFSNRLSIILLAISALAICALSSIGTSSFKDLLVKIASYLGVSALLLIIFGLILGHQIFVSLLTFNILLFWLITTIHHYLGSVKKYLVTSSHHIHLSK